MAALVYASLAMAKATRVTGDFDLQISAVRASLKRRIRNHRGCWARNRRLALSLRETLRRRRPPECCGRVPAAAGRRHVAATHRPRLDSLAATKPRQDCPLP